MMRFERGRDIREALNIKSYIYDNGFGPRWYVCGNQACLSVKQKQNIKGGFQPPDYTCQDCGETNYAPTWINLDPKTLTPRSNNVEYYRDPYSGNLWMD